MGGERTGPPKSESEVTAESWLAVFAESLGISPPDATVVQRLLEIAGVAAHSSESIAAPIACYLIGLSGPRFGRRPKGGECRRASTPMRRLQRPS